jgi:serine/threonine protein kinase
MFASTHPNVVPIIYACTTPSLVCLAMPYFRKGSLQDRIDTGPPPLRDAYRIADRFLGALSQIHVANFLHFDLKPSNVLFSDKDEPMIADFGQARLFDPNGTAAFPAMYKWGVPPEVYTHAVGVVESDIYQAGLTLYRLFNGDPEFRNQCAQLTEPLPNAIQKGRLPRRDRFLPHIPAGIRRVVRRALKVDPAHRYHTALEFQDALARVRVPLNWTVDFRTNGETVWAAHRDGRPDLEVHLMTDGSNGSWKVDVHTCSAMGRRRKGTNSLCAVGLTDPEADHHLRLIFDQLG